jgi:hypothetical protein
VTPARSQTAPIAENLQSPSFCGYQLFAICLILAVAGLFFLLYCFIMTPYIILSLRLEPAQLVSDAL